MTHENFLSKRTNGVEDSQVNTIMYCTGVFNSYHHRVSDISDVRKRDWSYVLADTEMDSLETKINFCREHDIDILWSMRMNDGHDAPYKEDQISPWKQKHLDWLFGRKDTAVMTLRYGTQFWSSVDYGVSEVRQLVYDIIKDTVTRYDLDGIQLDLTRDPRYFKQVAVTGEAYPETTEKMNNLIRSIRTMMDQVSIEQGKPLLLTAYVPDSMAVCKALGLDMRQLLEEDLFDMVAVRSINAYQSWEDSVAEYSSYDVPIHATIDQLNAFEKAKATPDYNQEAALAWNAGVDGIQIYNNFNPSDPLFDTLGSPQTCGPLDPNYKSLFKRADKFYMNIKNLDSFIKEIPYSGVSVK